MSVLQNLKSAFTNKSYKQDNNYSTQHATGSIDSEISGYHQELWTLKQNLMFQANQIHVDGKHQINWTQIAKDEKRLHELKSHTKHGHFFQSKQSKTAGGDSLHQMYEECDELIKFLRREKEGLKPTLTGDLANQMQSQFGADGSQSQSTNFQNNPEHARSTLDKAALGAGAIGAAGVGAGALGANHAHNHNRVGSNHNDTTGTGHQVGKDHTTTNTGYGVTGHREEPHIKTGHQTTTGGHQVGDDHTTQKTGFGLTGHREQPHGTHGNGAQYNLTGQQQSSTTGLTGAGATGYGQQSSSTGTYGNDTTGMGRQVGSDHTTANTGYGVTGHREEPHHLTGSHHHGSSSSSIPSGVGAGALGAAAGHQIGKDHTTANTGYGLTGHKEPNMSNSSMTSGSTGNGHQIGSDHTTANTGFGLTGHREQPHMYNSNSQNTLDTNNRGSALQGLENHLPGQHQGNGLAGQQQGAYDNTSSTSSGHQGIGSKISNAVAGAAAATGLAGHNTHSQSNQTGTGYGQQQSSSTGYGNDSTGMGRQVGSDHTTANTGFGVTGHREQPHSSMTGHHSTTGASGVTGMSSNSGYDSTGRQIGSDYTTQPTGYGISNREEPHTGIMGKITGDNQSQQQSSGVYTNPSGEGRSHNNMTSVNDMNNNSQQQQHPSMMQKIENKLTGNGQDYNKTNTNQSSLSQVERERQAELEQNQGF